MTNDDSSAPLRFAQNDTPGLKNSQTGRRGRRPLRGQVHLSPGVTHPLPSRRLRGTRRDTSPKGEARAPGAQPPPSCVSPSAAAARTTRPRRTMGAAAAKEKVQRFRCTFLLCVFSGSGSCGDPRPGQGVTITVASVESGEGLGVATEAGALVGAGAMLVLASAGRVKVM